MPVAPDAVPLPPDPRRGHDAGAADDGLDERSRAVLAFEHEWWQQPGAKEAAIRERFGMSATRYYQLLNALIDTPEAMAADPVTVRRLRRQRLTGRRSRGPRP